MTRYCPDCKIRPLEKGYTYCSECGEVRQYYSLLKAKMKYESKPETQEKMKKHRDAKREEYLKYQRDYYYTRKATKKHTAPESVPIGCKKYTEVNPVIE